ncbi:MAG: hypothetical protein EBU84_05650 [Actinobacteria bacterium]|nr:hypothetical protein [Actinomycetota bacterium]
MKAELPPDYIEAVWWYHCQTARPSPRNGATAYAATHPEVRRNALEVVFAAYLDGRDTAEAFAALMADSTTEGKQDLLLQLDTEVLPLLARSQELWVETRTIRSGLRAELRGVYGLV